MAGNGTEVPSILEEMNYPNLFPFLFVNDSLLLEFHFQKLLHLFVLHKELVFFYCEFGKVHLLGG